MCSLSLGNQTNVRSFCWRDIFDCVLLLTPATLRGNGFQREPSQCFIDLDPVRGRGQLTILKWGISYWGSGSGVFKISQNGISCLAAKEFTPHVSSCISYGNPSNDWIFLAWSNARFKTPWGPGKSNVRGMGQQTFFQNLASQVPTFRTCCGSGRYTCWRPGHLFAIQTGSPLLQMRYQIIPGHGSYSGFRRVYEATSIFAKNSVWFTETHHYIGCCWATSNKKGQNDVSYTLLQMYFIHNILGSILDPLARTEFMFILHRKRDYIHLKIIQWIRVFKKAFQT